MASSDDDYSSYSNSSLVYVDGFPCSVEPHPGPDSLGNNFYIPEGVAELVPSPSLMLCGDIEPNPGPLDRKRRPLFSVTPPRNARNTIVLSPSRFMISTSDNSMFAQRSPLVSPVPAIPAAALLLLILLYVFWPTAQPDERYVEPPAADSPEEEFSCAATAKRFEISLLVDKPQSHTQWDTDDPRNTEPPSFRIPSMALLRVLMALFLLLLRCGDVPTRWRLMKTIHLLPFG